MAAACLFSHASALGVISKEMRHRAGHDVHEHPLNLSSFLFPPSSSLIAFFSFPVLLLLNSQVAVKFERHGTRCPQLRHEYKVYRELTNCHGFCSVYHFGT